MNRTLCYILAHLPTELALITGDYLLPSRGLAKETVNSGCAELLERIDDWIGATILVMDTDRETSMDMLAIGIQRIDDGEPADPSRLCNILIEAEDSSSTYYSAHLLPYLRMEDLESVTCHVWERGNIRSLELILRVQPLLIPFAYNLGASFASSAAILNMQRVVMRAVADQLTTRRPRPKNKRARVNQCYQI